MYKRLRNSVERSKQYPCKVVAPVILVVVILLYSDIVDVTGISEFSVNNSTYQVADDSVILQNDAEKYEDSDESISDSDSSDEIERTDRYGRHKCRISFERA